MPSQHRCATKASQMPTYVEEASPPEEVMHEEEEMRVQEVAQDEMEKSRMAYKGRTSSVSAISLMR